MEDAMAGGAASRSEGTSGDGSSVALMPVDVRTLARGVTELLPEPITQMVLDTLREMPWQQDLWICDTCHRVVQIRPGEPMTCGTDRWCDGGLTEYWTRRRVSEQIASVMVRPDGRGFARAAYRRGGPQPTFVGFVAAYVLTDDEVRAFTQRSSGYEVLAPWFEDRLREGARIGHMSWVVVGREHRRQSVGRQLIEASRRHLERLGATHLLFEADDRNARWADQCRAWRFERVYTNERATFFGRKLEI